jgi:hypothetical protein
MDLLSFIPNMITDTSKMEAEAEFVVLSLI